MKINQIEQSTSYQIESLYKEKSEQERRYFLKVEESNKLQSQLREAEVNLELRIEKLHSQHT